MFVRSISTKQLTQLCAQVLDCKGSYADVEPFYRENRTIGILCNYDRRLVIVGNER